MIDVDEESRLEPERAVPRAGAAEPELSPAREHPAQPWCIPAMNASRSAWSGIGSGSEAGNRFRFSTHRSSPPRIGGRCVLSTVPGLPSTNFVTRAAKVAGSTWCAHGLSALPHASCADSQHVVGDGRHVLDEGLLHRRERRAEAIRAEQDVLARVVERERGRVVEQGRGVHAQRPVAEVDGAAVTDDERALGRDRIGADTHEADGAEAGDDGRVRRLREERADRAGVVAVGVGERDPSEVLQVDELLQRIDELVVLGRDARVDQCRLRAADRGTR